MAVCTDDFTLLDLLHDRAPTQEVTDHPRDIPDLVAKVIELEDEWIRFTAVCARMLGQVVPDPAMDFPSDPGVPLRDQGVVMLSVLGVPARVARSAVVLPAIAGSLVPIELVERLDRSA